MGFTRSPAPLPPGVFRRLALTFAFSVAVTLPIFTAVTAEHRYELADSPVVVAYGFPVPWHRANGAISMARNLDPKAALFDFVLYFVPVFFLLTALRRRRHWPKSLLIAAAVVGTLVGALGLMMAIGADPAIAEVPPDGWPVQFRVTTPYFGWGFADH